ncbi:hypothetical protein [Azotobacter salinestris]|uniref:hypothetical protein n=1 Tax=Azotobacter salinestris TaxID=69964 RepID=UPI001266CD08|nr:hypothetical protein [Azotobacter salinestris]
MDRSERRHHEQRIKARFYRKQHGYERWPTDKRHAGLFAHHGKVCSCWMCGNPRRYWGELTMQERRANLELKAWP